MTHLLSGSLLGTAAGDACGLPYEGLSPRRIGKRFVPRRYALIPLLHGGMVSDDTEHAVMAAQAWIDGAGDPEIFRRSLRGRLKWWFARLPAGIGLATLRSCLKMWLGLGRTGVYSAGNGPAMPAPVLGVLCDDLDELCRLVKISTELTHTDPKAYRGALAVALLAWYETRHPDRTTKAITAAILQQIGDNEFSDCLQTYAPDPKRGITGYMYHTVPAVFQTWQAYRDRPAEGLDSLIRQGGDTDTTAAIFGGIVGVRHGENLFAAVSGTWCEPLLTPDFFAALAKQADEARQSGRPQKARRFGGMVTFARNLLMMPVVLAHGFRRLLPPY